MAAITEPTEATMRQWSCLVDTAVPDRPAEELNSWPGVQKERLQSPAEQQQCPQVPAPAQQPWQLQGLAMPNGAAAPPRGQRGIQ